MQQYYNTLLYLVRPSTGAVAQNPMLFVIFEEHLKVESSKKRQKTAKPLQKNGCSVAETKK